MAEMKSLNGNTFVDQSARNEIEALKKNGVGGGGGDVTTEAMNKAIADAIQEHNEQIEVHPNRIAPMAEELMTLKKNVSELTAEKVGADPAGTAATKVSEHDTYTGSHNDIRLLIQELSGRLNALANSDDTTLDDLKEIVTYIKANKSLIDSITTSKVSVTDIIDNLTTNVNNRPLSAAQGVALKNLIDALGNSKLDASALGAAVDQALLIAKESGEFKGDKGDTGPQGPAYKLTETDKALIVAQVIESLGGNPIFGYVDEDNNIIVQGTLADGTYSVKYEMDNGSTVDIGNLVLDTNVYYSITKNLTNCVIDNTATQVVAGGSYSATVTTLSGYTLDSVSVTMGGSAVSVTDGVISIASVTGDIVITAVAKVIEPDPEPVEPTNFAVPNTTNKTDWSIWCNDARFGSDGAYRALAGNVVTNYVAMEVGDIIRFTGLNVPTTGSSMNQGLHLSDADKAMLSCSPLLWYTDNDYLDITVTDGVYEIDTAKLVNHTKAGASKYFRISGGLTGTVNDVVINVKRNGAWL